MPLIVSSILHKSWPPRGDVSPMCVYVDKKYLSQQYELTLVTEDYWVYGTVVDVSKVYGPLPSAEREILERHVIGRSVRLYLVPGILVGYDTLCFDKESWGMLRDAGVFPDEYRVKLKLLKVEVKGREVGLYPYRDVEVPEA